MAKQKPIEPSQPEFLPSIDSDSELSEAPDSPISSTDSEVEPFSRESKRRVTLSKGLSSLEVEARVASGFINQSHHQHSKSIKEIILTNTFTIFNLLNIAIAIWLISVGSFKNITFLPIIIINTIIGIIQELKAKKTMDSLSLLSMPTAKVVRSGKTMNIPINELVLDDIIILETGKQIPCDSIVRKGAVEVNESLLTGESDPVYKKPKSTLFAGSYVISGECYAKVERIGSENYMEQLMAQAKKYRRPRSEIMRSLRLLIRVVTVVVILVGTGLFLKQMEIGDIYANAVIYTAGGVIGMIPSGLFLLTSVSLAYGIIKLAKHNTLVQDLYCIEMLARVDVLCLDKTGTITDGTMKVKDFIELQRHEKLNTRSIISMLQGSLKDNNATSIALQKKFGKSKKSAATSILPFSSVRKYGAAYFKEHDATFVIGAPEFILRESNSYDLIKSQVDAAARLGYRVLLVAQSDKKLPQNPEHLSGNITPLALITIEDTIRKDAIETIDYFKKSGVSVRVISGDNPLTVSKVAKRAGIENADSYVSLDGLSDEEVVDIADEYTVFGRVSPDQKRILIKRLKELGNTVAMTGDGVNDILALKEADCSIAMANGSEATRNISHLVLLDSNFSSLPRVVREGRRVINNIQRVATLYLTKTIFSFLLSILVILLSRPYPIQTVQLMFYDVLIIGIPSFYLALEPNNTQIKGKFLFNVLASAIPGGILVIVNYLFILFIAPRIGMSDDAVSTSVVILTTIVGLMVLFRVCRPFNLGRRILFSSMIILFGFGLVFLDGLLELIPLETSNLLLILVIVQYSYPLLNFIINYSRRFRDFFTPTKAVEIE